MFILNPGDGFEVILSVYEDEAQRSLEYAKARGRAFARLYSYSSGRFHEFSDLGWQPIDHGQLPMKVLAVDNGPKPFLTRQSDR